VPILACDSLPPSPGIVGTEFNSKGRFQAGCGPTVILLKSYCRFAKKKYYGVTKKRVKNIC
jgi:hypothetical protein